jgi:hypothetical protein
MRYGHPVMNGDSTIPQRRETAPSEAIETRHFSAAVVPESTDLEVSREDISHLKTATGSTGDLISMTDPTTDSTMVSFSGTGITGLSTL